MLLLSSRVDIKITVAISTTLCSVHGCRDPGEDCGKTISQAHAYYESHQLLLVAVDTITTALDRKLCACVAFLDLRKASDSLDHHILLQKLSALGLYGTAAISWFVNYLFKHFHCVKNVNSYCSWELVRCGVPQDGALGPLLFLVCVSSQVIHGR